MRRAVITSVLASLSMLLATAVCGATVFSVTPSGPYPTPCSAVRVAAAGDTVQIDYNSGIPYKEPYNPNFDPNGSHRSDCVWHVNNLTIMGVNGRAILDASGEVIEKGIFNPYGAGAVISNLELRGAATPPGQGDNGAGVRVDSGGTAAPEGGDITIQYCYIHDNQNGVLTANVGAGSGGAYMSANPYIKFLHDEFAFNGISSGDRAGYEHNMYIGSDNDGKTAFTLAYSWSHDAYVGQTVKTRAPINNILYNLITDAGGTTSYLLDFPLGGSTYIVGNSLYKGAVTNSLANKSWMVWRDVGDNAPSDPEYGLPHEDLHFINNTVVLDPQSNSPTYVVVSCSNGDASACATPNNGPVLSVNAVVENNIFVGPQSQVTNQTSARQSNNLVQSYSAANLAGLFADWTHFNFHLVPGAAAIGAGVYSPTDNAGVADPKAVPVSEYVQPIGDVARPTPTGVTMDEGAYRYPRVDNPPNPTLTYTQSVTTPGTGTITLSGLPTPAAGRYNNAAFTSGNTALIPAISTVSSTTGTLVASFTAGGASATTVVPIDIYVNGAHLTASVTVIPGPVALQSITLDGQYYPQTTVHLTNASSSPVVVNLSTSDASILAVPASITIPAGQLSAETGSETGSLWGQTPASKNATITATFAGANVSLPVTVYAPFVNHFYCNVYPCTIVGGQPINNFQVAIAGDYPAAGGPVTFTTDNPAVIPNQTFQAPGGNFYTGFTLSTNSVTQNASVTVSISVNGSTKLPTQVVTVTPASGTNIAISSGSGQAAGVGQSFSNPLVALVQNGSTPVAGATVTFAGAGVSFPNGASAVSNSSGLAAVVAQPTTTGALRVMASTAGASATVTFVETGTSNTGGGTDVLAIGSGSTATAGTYVADEYFTGGAASAPTTAVIDTSLVTNPAPQAVYQNWRFGVFSYAIPNLAHNAAYTVRLHFSENLKTGSGQRQFNVTINGSQVLTNFDIFATAGSAYRAIAENFPVTSDGNGVITIAFTANIGNPQVNGIEIQTTAAAPVATVSSGSGQTAAVGSNFANPLVVLVTNGGSPVAGTTVTFAGPGVSFPSGASAVSNANGLASIVAQPATTGALTVTASVAGANTPATFSETGTPAVPGLSLNMSEDAYQGDAQFTVSIDGVGTGVTYTATVLHSSGNSQPINLGAVSAGSHTIAVTFLNDLYDGTSATDRNLFVNGATYNGVAIPNSALTLLSSGTQTFSGTFGDALVFTAAEDAYQGDAQYTVTIDGQQVGGAGTVTASHAAGQSQTIGIPTALSAGSHTVGISFINDAYGGSPSTDRNLYILGATYKGVSVPNSAANLYAPGTDSFTVTQ